MPIKSKIFIPLGSRDQGAILIYSLLFLLLSGIVSVYVNKRVTDSMQIYKISSNPVAASGDNIKGYRHLLDSEMTSSADMINDAFPLPVSDSANFVVKNIINSPINIIYAMRPLDSLGRGFPLITLWIWPTIFCPNGRNMYDASLQIRTLRQARQLPDGNYLQPLTFDFTRNCNNMPARNMWWIVKNSSGMVINFHHERSARGICYKRGGIYDPRRLYKERCQFVTGENFQTPVAIGSPSQIYPAVLTNAYSNDISVYLTRCAGISTDVCNFSGKFYNFKSAYGQFALARGLTVTE